MKSAICIVLITYCLYSIIKTNTLLKNVKQTIILYYVFEKCKKKLHIPTGRASSGAGTGMACVNASAMINIQPLQTNIFCVTDMFSYLIGVSYE